MSKVIENLKSPNEHFMNLKRYALIYLVSLVVANTYAFWPAGAYGNEAVNCPAIIASFSFQVVGASQSVGPPLYSADQFLFQPGSSGYELGTYNSTNFGNNLTAMFESGFNPLALSIGKINDYSGELNYESSKQTGLTIAFQNMTLEGSFVVKIRLKITVTSDAPTARFAVGTVCTAGYILTVGSIPYFGPLPHGSVQPLSIILSNSIALIGATAVSILVPIFYRKKMAI
jgi:hypothetical protein